MSNKDPTSTNDGYRLQISSNSSLSCESDLSSFSFDKEVDTYTKRMHSDELPAFEIRLMSPLGRSPSPIDNDLEVPSSPTHSSCITPTRSSSKKTQTNFKDNEDFVPLHDINAQISPPSDSDSSNPLCDNSPASNLETIFEGVFLNTPPRQKAQRKSCSSNSRHNLMERIAINRLSFGASGKENVLGNDEAKDK